jgi:hypothetical protein
MILSAAVFIGFGAGLVRGQRAGRRFRPFPLRWPGLVFLSFLAQSLVFNRIGLPVDLQDAWASLLLCGSQALLLLFALVNLRHAGLVWMACGLLMNFLVITLNGGWMPISPDTVRAIYPHAPPDSWQVGQRLGSGKDIVLYPEDTHLGLLADRFLMPTFSGYPIAFSLGDLFLAGGAGWLLWSMGGHQGVKLNGDKRSIHGIAKFIPRSKPGSQPAVIGGSYQQPLPLSAAVESG